MSLCSSDLQMHRTAVVGTYLLITVLDRREEAKHPYFSSISLERKFYLLSTTASRICPQSLTSLHLPKLGYKAFLTVQEKALKYLNIFFQEKDKLPPTNEEKKKKKEANQCTQFIPMISRSANITLIFNLQE